MSLDSTSQLGQLLAQTTNDTQDLASAISPDEDSPQTFRFYDETITIEQAPLKVNARNITTDAIWDLVSWDTAPAYWEGDYDNDPYLLAVLNKDYRFIDRLNTDSFIDTTNTTATVNTGSISFASDIEEYLYSDVIAYEPEDSSSYKNITSVTVNLTGTDVDNAEVWIKTDTNDWQEVVQGIKTTLTNPGEKLYYLIDNNNLITDVGFPTPFGEWGEANIGSMTITDIEIYYEVA